MSKSTYDVVDFCEIIWLKLAEFYPFKHFGKGGAAAHVEAYIRERYKFQWAKHEPGGPGTGGTIVGVLAGGNVMRDLDRLIGETATAVVGFRDNFDFTAWHTRWEGADLLDNAQPTNQSSGRLTSPIISNGLEHQLSKAPNYRLGSGIAI